jgi:hypothetical protein
MSHHLSGPNLRSPADDARLDLTDLFAFPAAGGDRLEDAEEALRTVLPDVLRYDRDRPAAYPNGRALTDDVLDARLAMVTNHKITGDGIGPHTDLLADFPYLGHPHRQPWIERRQR